MSQQVPEPTATQAASAPPAPSGILITVDGKSIRAFRSTSFFLRDGTLFILVEKTLFKIHKTSLTLHSKWFRELFGKKSSVGLPGEGDTEKFPLFIDGVTAEEFTDMLSILCVPFHTPPYEPKRLFNVLNLANMWQILQLRKWAILNIGFLPTEVFDVMMKLRASIQFKVEVWFESAFRELAFTDLRDMKDEQLEFIGMDVLVPLIRLYCEVETHKKSMVFNLPPCPAHSLKCIGDPQHHKRCKASWTNTWVHVMGGNILHPNHLLAFSVRQMNNQIQGLEIEKMEKDCLENARTHAVSLQVPQTIYELISAKVKVAKKAVGCHLWEEEFKEVAAADMEPEVEMDEVEDEDEVEADMDPDANKD